MMKRIGLIFLFLILMLCGSAASVRCGAAFIAQAEPQESVTEPAVEVAVPQAVTEPAVQMPSTETEEGEPGAAPLAVEEPVAPVATEPPWAGKRRVFRIVSDYRLAVDEEVTTLVIIAGNATLQGKVTGNVLVLGGDVTLASTAQINGTLRVIGGEVSGSTGLERNISVHNSWRVVPAGTQILMQPHAIWGVSQRGNLWLTVAKFVISCFTYLLVAVVFSRQVQQMEARVSEHPVGTVLFGILMLVFIPVLLCVLTLSIVGIPCVFLVLGGLFVMAIYGKTAIFLLIGGTLLSGRLKPLAVIFGYILYFMATSVPYIDWVTFLVVNSIAVGTCLLSGAGAKSPPRLMRNAYTPRTAVHY